MNTESPQVSRTLLSILADLNAVICMVSIFPLNALTYAAAKYADSTRVVRYDRAQLSRRWRPVMPKDRILVAERFVKS